MQPLQTTSQGSSATNAAQYLTFRLGSEELALAMSTLQEVVPYESITGIPLTPPWLRGVFSLRGRVLPVIDLGLRLGLPRCEPTRRSCILLLVIDVAGVALTTGILVDEVLDLLELGPDEIDAPPELGGGIKVEFLRGLHQRAGGTLLLVDPVRVFEKDELLELALAHQRLRAQRAEPRPAAMVVGSLPPTAADPQSQGEESCVHLFDEE